jgi:adenine-specific DNA-methyltransferase
VANGRKKGNNSKAPREAATYRHPEAESPLRPEVGTQAQFRKRKAPATYRYDSSLSPVLEWDGQNHAREQGEALIRESWRRSRWRTPRARPTGSRL